MQKSIHSEAYRQLLAWLRKRREEKGLTMRDLGERLGVPHSFVGKVETGERRLDVYEYLLYCQGLEIDPHQGLRVAQNRLPDTLHPSRKLIAAESRGKYRGRRETR